MVWGSEDRGLLAVGCRFFDFAQNDTENAQNDGCFAGMTVASLERQLLCQNDYGRVKVVRGHENGVSPGGLTGSEFIDARADLGLA